MIGPASSHLHRALRGTVTTAYRIRDRVDTESRWFYIPLGILGAVALMAGVWTMYWLGGGR